MPSPTSSTRPTCCVSILERYYSISFSITETISLAFNLLAGSREDLIADIGELGAKRAIELPIADADAQAGDQLGLHFQLQDRIGPQGGAQVLGQALALIFRQGDGRRDVDADAPRALIGDVA